MGLAGLRVIELAGLAPGPFAGLVLADNGASVIRIDRPHSTSADVLCRGKQSIVIDFTLQSGRKLLEKIISSADVLIDPFRPGVLERLGLGPEVFLGDEERKGLNERLIYAKIVGFPTTGAHKNMAGHDINYLALSGVLSMLPGKDMPMFPLNLIGDFGGGGLMSVVGILLALVERGKTGRGRVVTTDMVSGTRYLSSFPLILAHLRLPIFDGPRGTNILDGGAPFYGVYTCKDGQWMSLGCLEPKFFKIFLETFMKALPHDFDPCRGWKPDLSTQQKRHEWPSLLEYLTKGFLTQRRDFWANLFHGTDACSLPVLSPEEASKESLIISSSHPDLSNSPRTVHHAPSELSVIDPGTHTDGILRDLGISNEWIQRLGQEGVFGGTLKSICKL